MEFNLSAGLFAAGNGYVQLKENHAYDVLILGGGPAGLTAAVYCMRKGVDAGIILNEIGGQVAWTSGIENYPGYTYISGTELVERFREQVSRFSIGFDEGGTISRIEDGSLKKVLMEDGRIFTSRSLIVATGKSSRLLGVPGEAEYTGRGVAYCSICDAPLYRDRVVGVAGGGNSAIVAALDLAQLARSVILIHRRDRFTADRILIDKLFSFSNIEYLYGHTVQRLEGDDVLRRIVVRDVVTGMEKTLDLDGIFVEIGLVPNSLFARDTVRMTESGEIETDLLGRTDRPGIFAAGDVTAVPYKQIIIAAGDGARAALSACDYIQRLEK